MRNTIALVRRIGLVTLAISSAASTPLSAAEAPADDQDLEEVIVTAQQARKQVVSDGDLGALGFKDALATPFNVSNYTAQLVLDQQSETIGDVLDNDPAVRTTYGNGNQSELFVIRGFALFGDDVSINGLYGVTPRQLVSPELYDRVQVLNGANAFLFGAAPGGSGIGGGIDLVPKHAETSLYRVTVSFSADSIFGGNFDVGRRFGADEAFGARVVGVFRRGDTPVENDFREVQVLGAGLDYRLGSARFSLDVGYEDQRARWTRPILRLGANVGVPKPPDVDTNFGQPWTFTTLRDLYAIARADVDITDDIKAFVAIGMRDGSEDGEYSTVTLTNATTGAGTGSRLFVPREDQNESGLVGLRGRLSTGPVSHEFNVGSSLNVTENRNSFTQGAFPAAVRTACGAAAATFCANIYTPVTVDLPPNSTLPSAGGSLTDLPRVSTSQFTSYYASDTIGVLDDKWQITVGARRQNMSIKSWSRTTLQVASRYDESATTPVVGVVFRPTEHLSFYANRIEGLQQGPTAPNNAVTVNAGQIFPPFESVQYEIGGKIAFRSVTGTLALYQTEQPSAFSRPLSGNLVEFVTDGEQRNRGVELTLNGEPSKSLRFIGGISLSDAELTRTLNGATDGNKPIGVPDYQINFSAEFVPPFLKAATLTARAIITGPQMVNVTNTIELPSWRRFDLGLRYVSVLDRHPLTFRLSAENVTNKAYWYSSFGGYLLQGAPRTLKASVTFEY